MKTGFIINEPRVQDELNLISITDISPETKIEFSKLENQNENSIDLHDINASVCIFKNCRLSDIDFKKSQFVDVIFDCCDFSNCNFTRTYFKRVIFKNCKLVGTVFAQTHFIDARINDCNAKYANFTKSTFEKAEFNQSEFEYTSFNDCIFSLKFNECDFTSAGFLNTPLKDIDFSTSVIDDALFTTKYLNGAKVSAYQAMELSKLLGLIIK